MFPWVLLGAACLTLTACAPEVASEARRRAEVPQAFEPRPFTSYSSLPQSHLPRPGFPSRLEGYAIAGAAAALVSYEQGEAPDPQEAGWATPAPAAVSYENGEAPEDVPVATPAA